MTRLTCALIAGLTIVGVSTAMAQDAPGAQTGNAGPMTIQRVQNGFAVTPEVKATRLDHTTGVLAGATGGWVMDDTLLIGASGYWLTNGHDGRSLGYGGLVFQWMEGSDRPIRFAGRGLIGFGTATLPTPVIIYMPVASGRRGMFVPVTVTRPFSRDFAVFEPQADVLINLSRHLRLDGNVGYRLVGGDRGVQDNRIRGVTAGVGIQIAGNR